MPAALNEFDRCRESLGQGNVRITLRPRTCATEMTQYQLRLAIRVALAERGEFRLQIFHALLQRVAIPSKLSDGRSVLDVEPELLRQSIGFVP
jgi:hypothetical protein